MKIIKVTVLNVDVCCAVGYPDGVNKQYRQDQLETNNRTMLFNFGFTNGLKQDSKV